MRAAIYVRVSTPDQIQALGVQLGDLRRYAESRGWTVFREFVDVFSGASDSRPNLDLLMDGAKKRKFDVVLVWRFDRFARSSRFLITALGEFQARGILFVSYNENIDTGTPMGQAVFTIVAAVAQLERDIIRERVTAGVRAKRAKQGGRWGRRRTVNRDEVVRLRGEGRSYRAIAKKLGVSLTSVFRALQAAGVAGPIEAAPAGVESTAPVPG